MLTGLLMFAAGYAQADNSNSALKEIDNLLSRDPSYAAVYLDPPPYNGFAPPPIYRGPRPIVLGRPGHGKVPLAEADMKSWIGLGDTQYWIMTPLPERGSLGPTCWYEDWMTRRCSFDERW